MKIPARMIGVFTWCCFALLPEGNAQQLQRETLIAAYIYNFAKNIEWQNEHSIKDFHFLVFGTDENIMREMVALSKTKTLRDKPIRVSSSESPEDCSAAQLVFITKGKEQRHIDVFDRVEGKNVLLVSDGYQDKRLVMINFIESETGTLQFQINRAAIVNQKLRVMDDMVLLGGTVVDVVALYREGQESLRKLQKHTDSLVGNLKRLEDAIAAKAKEMQVQKDSLDRQAAKITEQQQTLDAQTQEFSKREKALNAQISKSDTLQSLVDISSRELQKLSLDLWNGEERLREQQEKIRIQQAHISSQTETLKRQWTTIHRQKSIVYLLLTILVLSGFLGYTVFHGYRNKKRLNLELKLKNDELAAARDRAESADRLKSAFLATMSHELRTPLNSIIGFTGIILQGLVGELNPEQRKQLVMVSDSARHLLGLINDVLDISKIEAGQLELRKEVYPIRQSIDKSVQVVRPLAEKKSLSVTLAMEPGPLLVFGDRFRIEQVLINLLNNAVKFTETGGITISVNHQEESPAQDTNGRNASLIRISIIDTGIGIKAEDMEKLFKPFRQIDTGTTRRYEGTGLGLSICKKLVGMHGGDIQVQSDGPGRGSAFTFTLPAGRTDNG